MVRTCPDCGDLAEVVSYVTDAATASRPGAVKPWTTIQVWQCRCGWAQDVEP